jgi:hypothetical protein
MSYYKYLTNTINIIWYMGPRAWNTGAKRGSPHTFGGADPRQPDHNPFISIQGADELGLSTCTFLGWLEETAVGSG